MPRKRNPDQLPGERLLRLFALLLFDGRFFTLSGLAERFRCSKQTILRDLDAIERCYTVRIERATEGNRLSVRMERPTRKPGALPLDAEELRLLHMTRSFVRHLLGADQYEALGRALGKARTQASVFVREPFSEYASLGGGRIDYTPHQETLKTLGEAIADRRVIRVSYRSPGAERPKEFHIKPLKLFSHNNALYVWAMMGRPAGTRYRTPDFDPILAVHRICSVVLDPRRFEPPRGYDFEKDFAETFGLIKDGEFEAVVDFSGYAATYVEERVWSRDQRFERLEDGTLRLTLRTASRPELIAWVLSFGPSARLRRPPEFVRELRDATRRMAELYHAWG